MDDKIFNAALAGLTHDIGKLEQRARLDPWKPPEGVENEGQPVHAAWTTYFTQAYIPEAYRSAALAGAYHHSPHRSPAIDKSLSEVVALADKLSAGERADLDNEQSRPPRQMVTIFDRVTFDGQGKTGGWHYLPLKTLTLTNENLFPGNMIDSEPEGDAYLVLCEELRQAARQSIPNPQVYLENLQAAMQRCTWSVPSAYYHSLPDISLYDHSRMTAALAVCLAKWPGEDIRNLLGAVERNFQERSQPGDDATLSTPVALLVGGDISGIQKFIYTISAKGAARMLRGRSFYLQLLTEAVLRFILDRLGLPYTNVIYSGGGHFYFLAPVESANALLEVRRQVTQKLLRHHGSSLYLALSWVSTPAHGFKVGHFPDYWSQVHRALAVAKASRYSELVDEDFYRLVFQPPAQGGNPDATCSVCGEDDRSVSTWDADQEGQTRICRLCRSFAEDIGRSLPKSSFLIFGQTAPKETVVGAAKDVLQEFGFTYQFLEDKDQEIELFGAERAVIWALQDPIGGKWPVSEKLPVACWLKYTVNQVPPFSFDELQNEVSGGFRRLGVLRLDVDNLGDIFTRGLGDAGRPGGLATLARLSTLSFQISLFFEGWVKKICAQHANKIYTVYAGGDDLFLVGPWDIMPRVAQEIRSEFGRYTCGHPALHLSGGLAFIDGKYPIYQAARDAAQAEDLAKDFPGKNAFTFLGKVWPWETFEQLADRKELLRRMVSDQTTHTQGMGGPESILHNLRQLADQEEQFVQARGKPVWGPWMWVGPYRLTRLAEQYQKQRPELAEALKGLRDSLDQNEYRDIGQWGAAARWAQLETRKKPVHKG